MTNDGHGAARRPLERARRSKSSATAPIVLADYEIEPPEHQRRQDRRPRLARTVADVHPCFVVTSPTRSAEGSAGLTGPDHACVPSAALRMNPSPCFFRNVRHRRTDVGEVPTRCTQPLPRGRRQHDADHPVAVHTLLSFAATTSLLENWCVVSGVEPSWTMFSPFCSGTTTCGVSTGRAAPSRPSRRRRVVPGGERGLLHPS